MTKVKRLSYIDIAKGIAVLLVIFGHTFRESMRADFYWCDFSYRFVYRFHVSLLFILSGMGYALTREKNVKQHTSYYIKKKAKSLLLPYVSYSLIIYGVFGALQMIPQFKGVLSGSSYEFIPIWEYLIDLLKNENSYCFHIWYLQTLFLFTVFAYFVDKYLSESLARILKIAVILAAPIMYDMFFSGAVWAVKGFVQKILFFLLGTCLSDEFIQKHKKGLSVGGVICGLCLCCMVASPVTAKLYEIKCIGTTVAYLENGIIFGFCMGIIALCAILEKKLNKFADFGRSTMGYYLYHQPFCCAFLGIVLYEKMHISAVAVVLICMGASVVVPYLVLKIINKTRLCSVIKKLGLPTQG